MGNTCAHAEPLPVVDHFDDEGSFNPWPEVRPDDAPLRILTIDGGGIRGYAALMILKELEDKCGVKLRDMYDLIGGTSIGGILAVTRGHKGYSHEFISRQFETAMVKFFQSFSLGNLITTGFEATVEDQDKLVTSVVGEAAFTEMFHRVDGPYCFVSSTCFEKHGGVGELRLIRNYPMFKSCGTIQVESDERSLLARSDKPKKLFCTRAGHPPAHDWTLADVIKATSAAPPIIPPVRRNHVYADGALLLNNPSFEALMEAKRVWPGRKVAYLHSIGLNGSDDKKPEPKLIALRGIDRLAHAIAESYVPHRYSMQIAEEGNFDYVRVELPVEDIDPFAGDQKTLENMASRVKVFLKEHNEGAECMEAMVADVKKAMTGGFIAELREEATSKEK